MMNRTILLDTQHHASIRTREGFSQKKCCRRVADVAKVADCGALAELVYALVLGTSVFGHESSSLLRPTKIKLYLGFPAFTFFIKTVSAILSFGCKLNLRLRMSLKHMPLGI